MNKLSLYQTAHMDYPYTLPPLDYAYDALAPHIDEQTMHLHHDKHHQAYVDHANEKLEEGPGTVREHHRLAGSQNERRSTEFFE
jgi:superoxide dismutase